MGGFETSIIPTVAPLLVLACVGIYVVSRHRKGSSARSLAVAWPQTMGTVLSATVQVSHHGNSRQAAILANGTQYRPGRRRFKTEDATRRRTDPHFARVTTVVLYCSSNSRVARMSQ